MLRNFNFSKTALLKIQVFRYCDHRVKGKGFPQQAEVAQGIPGGLRPRIFLTFSTTRVKSRQPYAPAAFTSEEILGTHF
jgi:hypothetical protein